MSFEKKLMSASMAVLLSACGGGGSSAKVDDNSGETTTPPPVVSEQVTFTGQASKGTLVNAQVTVYKYVDNVLVEAAAEEISPDSQLITDDAGNYSVTLIGYTGPIKIVISPSQDANAPTTMMCDAPSGCGDVAFGSEVNLTSLEPNFSLSATTNVSVDEEITVNVTPLTHMASALIEEKINDGETISENIIDNNNAVIASIFNIEGDITQLSPTPVENTAAAAEEDNETELRYGLINAGIAEALYSGSASTGIEEKIAEMVADIVESDGALLATDEHDDDETFELSITDVLAKAAETATVVADKIKADDSLDQSNAAELDTTTAELVNEIIVVEQNTGEDGRVTPIVEETTDGDAVAKAKAMVQDVRVFSHLLGEELADGTHSDSHIAISNNGETFADLVDDSIGMVESQSDNLTLLNEVIDALSDISQSIDSGLTALPLENVSLDDFLITSGFTGSVSYTEVGHVISVQAQGNGQTANLDASITLAEDGLSVTMAISGEVSNDDASLMINDGSQVTMRFEDVISQSDIDNDTIDSEETGGAINLDVEIAQKATATVTNPVTFKGKLSADLVFIPYVSFYQETEYWESGNYAHIERNNETLSVPKLFSFSGEFSSLDGDKFEASLTVNVDNADTYTIAGFNNALDDFERDIENYQTINVDLDESKVTATQGLYKIEVEFTPGTTAKDYEIINTTYTGDDYAEKVWTRYIWSKSHDFELADEVREIVIIFCDESEALCQMQLQYVTPNQQGIYTAHSAETDHNLISVSKNIAQHYIDNQIFINNTGEPVDVLQFFVNNRNVNVQAGETPDIQLSAPYQALTVGAWPWFNGNDLHPIFRFFSWEVSHPLNENYSALLFNGITTLEEAFYFSYVNKFVGLNNYIDTQKSNDGIVSTIPDYIDFSSTNTDIRDGYISKALVKNAYTVSIEADEIIATNADENVIATITFDKGENTYDFEATDASGDGVINRTFSLKEVTSDFDEHPAYVYTMFDFARQRRNQLDGFEQPYIQYHFILPFDEDDNGIVDFYYLMPNWLTSNAEGELTYTNGELFSEEPPTITAAFGDNIIPLERFTSDEAFAPNPIYWNPFFATDIVNLFKSVGFYEYKLTTSLEGLGAVERRFEEEDYRETISVGDEIQLDGHLYQLFDGTTDNSKETESNYFDVAAAINVSMTLGEYDVDVGLSGTRTEFNQGDFELSMAYQLPESDSKRSFILAMNSAALDDDEETESAESDVVLLSNHEGVTVEFTDFPDSNPDDNQHIIGKIWFQETADSEKILAGLVVKRDGNALIIYDDGTIESL